MQNEMLEEAWLGTRALHPQRTRAENSAQVSRAGICSSPPKQGSLLVLQEYSAA